MLFIVKAFQLLAALDVGIAQHSIPAIPAFDYVLQQNRVESRQLLQGFRQVFGPLGFILPFKLHQLPGCSERRFLINLSQIRIHLHHKLHVRKFVVRTQNRRLYGKVVPGVNCSVLRLRFRYRHHLPTVSIWKLNHIPHLCRHRFSLDNNLISSHGLLIPDRPDGLFIAHGFLSFHNPIGADLRQALFGHTVQINIIALLSDLLTFCCQQIAGIRVVFCPALYRNAALHRRAAMFHGLLIGNSGVFPINGQFVTLASGKLLDVIIPRDQGTANPAVPIVCLVILYLIARILIGGKAAVSAVRFSP